ncbi:MAG: hypothetical protein ABW056_07735 [Thermoanaerobaculia bacterium]
MRIQQLATAAILALAAGSLHAQEEPAAAAPETEQAQPAPAWEFGASVYGYFPPEDTDYGQPTVTADREGLHLEARYNYEGIGTGSAWVGWNVGVGDKLRLDATLMAGGIFGDFNGVAPGYHLTISWGPLELYSEGEYVFDLDDSESNYFYNWAQLGYSPWEWLTIGFASQRTRAYETGLDVQRGPYVAFTYKSTSLAVYVFNGDAQPPTVVTSLSVSF